MRQRDVERAVALLREIAADDDVIYRMAVVQFEIVGRHSDSLRAEVIRQARADVLALIAALEQP